MNCNCKPSDDATPTVQCTCRCMSSEQRRWRYFCASSLSLQKKLNLMCEGGISIGKAFVLSARENSRPTVVLAKPRPAGPTACRLTLNLLSRFEA